jgi:hypothetical protein
VGDKAPLTWQELAARQDDVLGWRQALDAGLPQAAWDWKLERGLWRSLGPGVAVLHSGTPDEQQLRWGAEIHAGEGAAISGDASLVYFGVRRLTPVTIDVAVPVRRAVRSVTHEQFSMTPHRVTGLSQWSAGHPHLCLVHVEAATLHAVAWAASDEAAEERLTMVVQQRKTTVAALRIVLEQMQRLPRRGLVTVVLDDIEFGATAASELDYLRFCRGHGLPVPDEMQVRLWIGTTRYLDARYRQLKISVEIDGGHHMWVEQWNADTLRSLELAVASRGTGELSIRITRAMMRHHADRTAALLRQLLVP